MRSFLWNGGVRALLLDGWRVRAGRERFLERTRRFVADDPPSRGPLSGLGAVLARMHTKHLLALAIDMPFMTEKYLRFLCGQIEPGRGVLPKIDNRAEPLAAIYPQEAAAEIGAA